MVSKHRGQLILVTAILIALTVLASVVLLNAIHTPADLQTEALSEGTDRIQHLDHATRADLDRMFVGVTGATLHGHSLPFVTNTTALSAAVDDSMTIRTNMTAKQAGSLVAVEYNGSASVIGTAVYQTTNETFTDASGNSSWAALSDVSQLTIEMNVTTANGTLGTTDRATLTVNNTTTPDTWRLTIAKDGINTSDSGMVCGASELPEFDDGRVQISVRQRHGTVWVHTAEGTARCGEFHLGGNQSAPWTVGFENGETVTGNYGIAGIGTAGTAPNADSSVVVNPGFDVTYVADGITYETTYALYNRTHR